MTLISVSHWPRLQGEATGSEGRFVEVSTLVDKMAMPTQIRTVRLDRRDRSPGFGTDDEQM